MIPWSRATNIAIPEWVTQHQESFQSIEYSDDNARMEFVLRCAEMNMELAGSAPLAAAVFSGSGTLISVGVDAEGIGGHEMTNALIVASNVIGSDKFRAGNNWELFSLAPPCLVCLGNIYSEKPHRFVYAVSHEALLSALSLPDTPMPSSAWKADLEQREIKVEEMVYGTRAAEILARFASL